MILRVLKSWTRLVLLSLCFALAACRPSSGAYEEVRAAKARNDGPPIWAVKDHNSTLYLFGTVHLLPSDLQWQKDDMRGAFARAGTIFFEVDSAPAAMVDMTLLVQKLGQLEGGEHLTSRLDEYETKLLTAAAYNGDVPLALLDKMQPWLASELLTVAAASKVGLSPDLAADEALKSRAARLSKNIIFLDSVESQIRITADQPSSVQMELLLQTLERFNGLGEEFTRIAIAWAEGDVPALKALTDSGMATRLPSLYKALYTDRNEAWVLQMMKFLEGSGDGFAAIGVSHLLGENTLQDLLRDQGYEVTRYYAFQGEPVIKPVALEIINPEGAQ